jgi:Tfp pilus assembly protein FimT
MELMITLAIIGIVLSLTIPSMATMIIQAQIQAKADVLVAGIARARAEAFKRNTSVTITYSTADGIHGDGGYAISCTACPTITSITEGGGAQNFNLLNAAGALAAKTTFDGFGNLSATNPDGSPVATVLEGQPKGFGLLGVCKPANVTSKSPCQVNLVISTAGAVRTCRPSLPTGASSFSC